MSSQSIIPTLHHLTSSQSVRILWALEELSESHGVKYNLQVYERSTSGTPPGLLAAFPLGKSPILTLADAATGEPANSIYQLPQHPAVLTESRLILAFLDAHFAEGAWRPSSEQDRRQDEFLQEYANFTLATRANMPLLFEVVPDALPWGLRHLAATATAPVVAFFRRDLRPMFQLLEDTLSEAKPWFAGDKLGLADFNMIWPVDMSAQRGYFDGKDFPKLNGWYEKVKARPAWQRTMSKGGFYDLRTFIKK